MSPREGSTRDSHRILLELSRGVAGQWFQGITSMDSWNNEWFSRGMKEYLKYTVAATLVSIGLPLILLTTISQKRKVDQCQWDYQEGCLVGMRWTTRRGS